MNNRQSAGILLYRQDRAAAHAAQAEPHAAPAEPRATANPAETPARADPRILANPEVFLVHPGGPFWKNKHTGTWTIPKGEFTTAEPALDAAIREFHEETGTHLKGHFIPLSPIRQKGGKRVYAWAIAGDLDPAKLVSNTFDLEWPPGSGRMQTFPEVDRGAWYTLEAAREMINPAQIAFLDELATVLSSPQPK